MRYVKTPPGFKAGEDDISFRTFFDSFVASSPTWRADPGSMSLFLSLNDALQPSIDKVGELTQISDAVHEAVCNVLKTAPFNPKFASQLNEMAAAFILAPVVPRFLKLSSSSALAAVKVPILPDAPQN